MGEVPKLPTAFASDPSGRVTKRVQDAKHLAFIRTLPSVISCFYGVEACHIRAGSPQHGKPRTGMGRKPSDQWVLPMTPREHRLQHSMAELDFYRRHGIADPFHLALSLYGVSGDFDAAVDIIKGDRPW